MTTPGKPTSLIGKIDAGGIPLLLARLGVGGMFAYMAIMKIVDPIEFLKQIREYNILPADPPVFLTLTAATLPWLELLCAVALLLGVAPRGAALVINGMLLFFTPMLIWRAQGMVAAGEVQSFCDACFDCGCGTGVVCICRKVAENAALQIGALIVLFSRSRRFCLTGESLRKIDATTVPVILARLGVGGMFAYMAIMKIVDPIEFLKQIREYQILPTDPPLWLTLTAVTLPALELLCAIALLTGVGRRGAALLINGMLLFFTPMLILRALGMVEDGTVHSFCEACFDCGCGTGVVCICRKVTENVALQAGALIALFSACDRFTLLSLLRRRGPQS